VGNFCGFATREKIKINNRPRKILKFNTPSDLFYNFAG
jgi:IS30 family transposase